MAAAGAILVKTMNLVAGKVRPGTTTADLDRAAEKFIRSQGAEPAFKGYRGFPGSICTSPNSEARLCAGSISSWGWPPLP